MTASQCTDIVTTPCSRLSHAPTSQQKTVTGRAPTTWHRILDCIERIQAQKREQGEAVGVGREDDADSKIAPPGGAGLLSVLGISVTIGESPRSAPYKGHRSQYGA
jgi:hypothetical protein